ncbi:tetratricopeptide repeat protein [Polaromonas eurypsychrophila]|uniref:Uncharacterized protein n=1 Tax=Polaromonas eurypsychrophila TaxID=1614635 RepID=A0A916SMU3_9BURK|nr:hypothetical protein [Polaromonas eurypsychrophila]GGB07928.1 hypothetical protein GCM10011496_31060 [Polaromonas eurypsychrophila]
MSEPTAGAIESDTPLFDVVINVPPGAQLEEIERLARDVAGIAADKVDRLIHVLRSSPQAKIGAGVTREKADVAREQFSKAGLLVTITPLLTIQTVMVGSYDGTYSCPACQKRVVLPENRQCPACGIFVDKVTDEFLLRRKMMEQERGRIEYQQAKSVKDSDKRSREMMEAAMRAQVREEVEKEYGIKGKKGLSGMVKAVGVLALLMVAFVGGKGLSPDGLPWGKSASSKDNGQPKVMSADSLEKTAQATGADADSATGASSGAAAGGTVDPDLDDPLIQAAAGKQTGGKQLTLEQALAASKTLAKSVGNTTADRAMAGGAVGGKAGNAASQAANDAIDSAIDNPASSVDSGGRTTAGGNTASNGISFAGGGAASGSAGSATAAGAGGSSVAVPKQTKQVLTAEFAKVLAEIGQSARAREVLKAALAASNAASEPEGAAALRNADIKARAWAIQRREIGPARVVSDELKAKIMALDNAAERSQLLGSVAAILSQGGQIAPAIPRDFLSLAADALKSVTGPGQPNAALGDLAVSMAEVFANEASARIKAGMWSKAQASAAQIEGLIKQAPDAWSQLRLYAIDHQIKQQMGQSDKARKSLDAALAEVGKNGNLLQRAAWLRSVAQLSDNAADEQLQALAISLQAQLEPQSGADKARALTQLALLYAAGGLPSKADQSRRMAQSTAALSPADSTAINTDLIVRSDLAMAKVLQGLGRYAEAESLLQRVGGYLL